LNERIKKLQDVSLSESPSISHERAVLLTEFYRSNEGKYSIPVTRAKSFYHLCEYKSIYIGEGELIVGERGPRPKAVPTYPELTCHSIKDLQVLDAREKTSYKVPQECLDAYEKTVIPYWQKRSMREHIFENLSEEWHDAYHAGIFTEFMEQRAPGHTVLDDKIYKRGILDFKNEIIDRLHMLDSKAGLESGEQREELKAMAICCDAVILFARRHADLALEMSSNEKDPTRRAELKKIAEINTRVPAHAPETFYEAIQYYWWCHLAVITELNGWDAFNPGHLDQHLLAFYNAGNESGSLTTAAARELLEAFFIKFNNHPAPPKVGVTAEESGTYTDFANINIGGLLPDGSDGSNPVSHILLDIVDEMHLLQPSTNIQLSRDSAGPFLEHALRVVRKGYGFPSIFNTDAVVEEQLRIGKTLEDARAGGCSGCVETGAFGKEAFILTGYLNLVKILEITLHNGVDPSTGKKIGAVSGDPAGFRSFDELLEAYSIQFRHFLSIKMEGNHLIEGMYADLMPAPFLSVLIDDCIKKGKDYNAGGARYNNNFIQLVGIGSLTDSFAALNRIIFEEKSCSIPEFLGILESDFKGSEQFRLGLLNRMPKYGNDDAAADNIMVRLFNLFFNEIDGKPNRKGGHYRVEMLPTTCHVYFGSITGATPDGRRAGSPLSEGISPVQGADRNGPTAVLRSAAKMDHIKTGGTLLNMKFIPSVIQDDTGLSALSSLVRSYFSMGGHHIQFNIVDAETLKKARLEPESYRDLIVRVAGYSDYFCDLSADLQEEIISRTAHSQY
jgi:trans-4-hydroxy-L-proline dehydratase